MLVAIIPADETLPIRFENITPSLGKYQEIVGGYIEPVHLPQSEAVTAAMDLYANEEGLIMRLPYNPRASWLYVYSFERPDLALFGDVFIAGDLDKRNDLSEKQVTFLKSKLEWTETK